MARRIVTHREQVEMLAPWRVAAVTQDLVNGLHDEFHDWVGRQALPPPSDGKRGPIGLWPNVENFLKDRYPAAHRDHRMGLERAKPLLDISLNDPDSYDPQADPRGWKRDEKGRVVPKTESDNLLKMYETGPEAVAQHGYDPAEVAAGMVLLHNQSHPFRGDLAQEDQDRLNDIAQKRTKMQRDYESRQPVLARVAGKYGDLPEGLDIQHMGIDRHGRHMVNAYHDDKHVGQLVFTTPKWGSEIDYITTHPDYRRRGVGTAMFNWAKENVDPELTHATNVTPSGKGFAQSFGFKPTLYNGEPTKFQMDPVRDDSNEWPDATVGNGTNWDENFWRGKNKDRFGRVF